MVDVDGEWWRRWRTVVEVDGGDGVVSLSLS